MSFTVDHVLVLHDDLAVATQAAHRLGFATTPEGHHGDGLGTHNTTMMMPDRQTYIELLAVATWTPRNAAKRAALADQGPHIFGVAFKGDAHRAHAHFSAIGMDDGPTFDFARAVEVDGANHQARFTVTQMRHGALPGLYSFVCQQHTPDLVWRQAYLRHPNGSRSLRALEGTARDPEALTIAWSAFMDGPVAADAHGLTVPMPTTTLTVRPGGQAPCALTTLVVEADLPSARKVLAKNGVTDATDAEDGILVPDTIGLGAAVRFVPPQA